MNIIPISYPLAETSPLYPGTPQTRIEPHKSQDKGDSANTSLLTFSSHAGTHIDTPRHFCKSGMTVRESLDRVTTFFPCYCINLPVSGEYGIRNRDLEEKLAGKTNAEAFLIRTGTGKLRSNETQFYASSHPWVHAEVAEFLRVTCPQLRLLGLDTISIATPAFRADGRESHRAFLCDKRPLLLLEDADLSCEHLADRAFTLYVLPWFIDELDGVPVTAFLQESLQ